MIKNQKKPVRPIRNVGRRNAKSRTRDEAYQAKGGKEKRESLEKRVMLDIGQNGPSNSRVISIRLNEERTSVNKALRQLELKGRIFKAFDQSCNITGRNTHHYDIAKFQHKIKQQQNN